MTACMTAVTAYLRRELPPRELLDQGGEVLPDLLLAEAQHGAGRHGDARLDFVSGTFLFLGRRMTVLDSGVILTRLHE